MRIPDVGIMEIGSPEISPMEVDALEIGIDMPEEGNRKAHANQSNGNTHGNTLGRAKKAEAGGYCTG